MPQITVFRNIQETDTPFYREVSVVLDRIRDGANSNGEPIDRKSVV